MERNFNILITGVGGQGMLTLMAVIAQAAANQGYDVKTSELHGLAQRGGTAPCTIRIGKKIHSALIPAGHADLVLSLELLEGLRACRYGSRQRKTVFLINTQRIFPTSVIVSGKRYPTLKKILKNIQPFSSKAITINASEVSLRETGRSVMANIYMLGYAVGKCLLPIKKKFVAQAIKQVVPKKYLEDNMRIFELGVRAGES